MSNHDHIVADAHAKRDQIDGQRDERHALAERVGVQRQRAAALLHQSRDAVARNHFAEAIVKSMRRPE